MFLPFNLIPNVAPGRPIAIQFIWITLLIALSSCARMGSLSISTSHLNQNDAEKNTSDNDHNSSDDDSSDQDLLPLPPTRTSYLYSMHSSAIGGGFVSCFSVDSEGKPEACFAPESAATLAEPIGMVAHPNSRFLYVANKAGRIDVFKIDHASGALTKVHTYHSMQPNITQVFVDPNGLFLFLIGSDASRSTITDKIIFIHINPETGQLSNMNTLTMDSCNLKLSHGVARRLDGTLLLYVAATKTDLIDPYFFNPTDPGTPRPRSPTYLFTMKLTEGSPPQLERIKVTGSQAQWSHDTFNTKCSNTQIISNASARWAAWTQPNLDQAFPGIGREALTLKLDSQNGSLYRIERGVRTELSVGKLPILADGSLGPDQLTTFSELEAGTWVRFGSGEDKLALQSYEYNVALGILSTKRKLLVGLSDPAHSYPSMREFDPTTYQFPLTIYFGFTTMSIGEFGMLELTKSRELFFTHGIDTRVQTVQPIPAVNAELTDILDLVTAPTEDFVFLSRGRGKKIQINRVNADG